MKEKYVRPDGTEYASRQDYYNSPDLDPDIIGVMLATGRRQPQDDYERDLLAEMNEMKEKGIGIEFPFN